MKLFGFEITRAKANPIGMQDAFRPVWWPVGSTVHESYPGAWQQNAEVRTEETLAYWAVFRCISIIASDIAKLPLNLVRKQGRIWVEAEDERFSPFIVKPNRYQTRIQFFQSWLESKLSRGNTYVLKQSGTRPEEKALYVLDPCRVKPLVSESGLVFYQLDKDNLSELTDNSIVVPASEIIHDRWNTLYHPLVGLSPLYAAGLNALAGLNIQNNSARFFGNNSQPGGVLTAPGPIPDETARRLKEHWEQNFTGKNVGKIAVLGDGLAYQQMAVTATDAQLIEQLKWSAETIAGAFGVPAYMLNIGGTPAYNNVEALRVQYYSQCLQALIESVELCLDDGLKLRDEGFATQFHLDDLLQMDTATKTTAAKDAIGAGFLKPNEARARFNLPPVKGGDTPYLQQQNFSLEALDARDKAGPAPSSSPTQRTDQDVGEENRGFAQAAQFKAKAAASRRRYARAVH